VNDIDRTRRALLRRIGGTAVAAALFPGFFLNACDNGTSAGTHRGAAAHYGLDRGPLDVDLRLRAHPDTAPILSGARSEVWRYTAELIKGPQNTLASLGESYLGPTIRLRRGQRFRTRLENGLPEDTTVHWHGLHVPPDVDGQPRLPIKPGEAMTVAFKVVDRPGMYWYHPHPHGPDGGRVGFQSYAGLAGPLVIEDEAERALGLPDGDREMILVLQDRSFARDNALSYIDGGMGAMMTRMRGFLGDQVLVNGLSSATAQRLQLAYLQTGLERWPPANCSRYRRRPAGDAASAALRHARPRPTHRPVGGFVGYRAGRRTAPAQPELSGWHDGQDDGEQDGRLRAACGYSLSSARSARDAPRAQRPNPAQAPGRGSMHAPSRRQDPGTPLRAGHAHDARLYHQRPPVRGRHRGR